MGRKKLALIFSIFILILIVFIFSTNENRFFKEENRFLTVCVKGNCFLLEKANDILERERGLMFREKIGDRGEEGMIFIFEEESIPGFWMKNTLINLDILWINKEKKIIGIVENISSCDENCPLYYPPEKIMYVIEIGSGEVKKKNISLNELVYFSEEL